MADKNETQAQSSVKRKFNPFLALGITLLPIIFVWFLLRKGHSTTARIIGLFWTGLFVLAMIGAANSQIGRAHV